tara:strand:+ start:940 stop:1488 length:549 start_codon:yes stop_codon:yes gene_type:complete
MQFPIVASDHFSDWITLNDTIMGGSSTASCIASEEGLILKGNVVEEDGGFISCLSPIYLPSLDLSSYTGITIFLDGGGRTFKLALRTELIKLFSFSPSFLQSVRWVAEVPTNESGSTRINIPFDNFQATIRARKIFMPINLQTKCINQFQLLHSKFGKPGRLNDKFKAGSVKILLRSISGFH